MLLVHETKVDQSEKSRGEVPRGRLPSHHPQRRWCQTQLQRAPQTGSAKMTEVHLLV
jgi:hypothetical protein